MDKMANQNKNVPIWEKHLLTVTEAECYFSIGEKKIRKLVDEFQASEYDFFLHNGVKLLIKRKKFKMFLNETTSIQDKRMSE